MEVRTFRAKSMQEALRLVRRELGPSAAVLHTREVGAGGLLRWIRGRRGIEVTASTGVCVPSRLTPAKAPADPAARAVAETSHHARPASHHEIQGQLSQLQSMVEELCRRTQRGSHDLPQELFHLYTDLIDAELGEDLARELVERVRA